MAEYNTGTPSQRVADMFKVSKPAVLKILREAGVELRWPRITSDEIRQAAQLYESGLSLADVGKRLNREASTRREA
ncbi:helix-turn-helix domain-containing protein [Kribbella koreensis]|uniref:helix-turn-helix domain-containing protein n=1 Tax=Kribbella koreensis TaxID=57909 RepID=UPI0031DB6389